MQHQAFAAPGRFHKGNLHTHSTLSDGTLAPEEVCQRYAEAGYDFVCLSDHLVGRYGYPIADTRPYRTNRFTTLLGAEVHSGAMRNGELWHLLAVGLPEDFAPPHVPDFETAPDQESAASLAARAAAAGAFVALAHPEWFGLGTDDARTIEAAHAVEIYNHGCHVGADRGFGIALWDLLLGEGRRLTGCATDDAHFAGPDHFGGWVMVKAEANAPDALLAALRAGEYYASTGPELYDVRLAGGEVRIACSPAVNVIALGKGSAGTVVHGAGLTEVALPLRPFEAGGWVRVAVQDAGGGRAWSNPIWLGDGGG
ncbi:MAG: CehA/McbA family metallohydrolase [Paracoccaceae bacterium]